MRLSDVTGATIRRWICTRALEIGDDFHERSKEYQASGDIRTADYYYAAANGAWEVVKAIQHGSFKPARRAKAKRTSQTGSVPRE